MPTDNPLLDPALRQAIRQNIDDIAQDRSHVVRDVCQDVLDALRLLDEQDRRIAALESERTCAVHASLCDLICAECFETEQTTHLRAELKVLEQERDALRTRVREAFCAGYHAHWTVWAYTFDPALCPGEPEGAFAAWKASTATWTLEDGTPRA